MTAASNANRAITFYAVPTANSQRVAIALEELGLSYQLHVVNRSADEQHGEAFRAINPAGMAPVIVDPDGPGSERCTVAQSGAILIYLAEQTGRLLPDDGARRAAVLQWLMHVMVDVNATGSVLYFSRAKLAEPPTESIAFFESRLIGFLRDCEHPLRSSEYLAGELSIADIALYPLVAPRRALIAQHGLEHLSRWADRMLTHPSVSRGMSVIPT